MLTLTDNAQAVVKGLADDAGQPDSGLRIAMDQGQLAVSLVTQPQPTDVVVDAGEAKVYVAEDTAPTLDDQTLDAAPSEQGVSFTLTPQG